MVLGTFSPLSSILSLLASKLVPVQFLDDDAFIKQIGIIIGALVKIFSELKKFYAVTLTFVSIKRAGQGFFSSCWGQERIFLFLLVQKAWEFRSRKWTTVGRHSSYSQWWFWCWIRLSPFSVINRNFRAPVLYFIPVKLKSFREPALDVWRKELSLPSRGSRGTFEYCDCNPALLEIFCPYPIGCKGEARSVKKKQWKTLETVKKLKYFLLALAF